MRNCIFFIGAGASVPFGVPTMTEMVQKFETWMKESHYALAYVVDEIKNKLSLYKHYDIEALITVLQDIINYEAISGTLLNNPSLHFFSPIATKTFTESINTLGKMYHNEAIQILNDVKKFITEECEIKNDPYELYTELFNTCLRRYDFVYKEALRQGNKNIENEIFTTNYDQVLEAYCSNLDIQCETGEQKGKLDLNRQTSLLYQSTSHCIFKLHGSVNWYIDAHGNSRASSEPIKIGAKTSLGHKVDKEFLLYPAYAKYTYREPFYSMFHHLKDRLSHCKMCCVIGYSFRDEDILGIFHDALMINKLLYLVIIDPQAGGIKANTFSIYNDRVHPISGYFDTGSINLIDNISA